MIFSSLLNLQSVQWLSDYKLWRCIQTDRSVDMIKLASPIPAIEIPSHPPCFCSSPSLPPPMPSPSQHSHPYYSSSPATPPHHPPFAGFFFINFHEMFWVDSSQTTSVSPIRDHFVIGNCEAPVWSCLGGGSVGVSNTG